MNAHILRRNCQSKLKQRSIKFLRDLKVYCNLSTHSKLLFNRDVHIQYVYKYMKLLFEILISKHADKTPKHLAKPRVTWRCNYKLPPKESRFKLCGESGILDTTT